MTRDLTKNTHTNTRAHPRWIEIETLMECCRITMTTTMGNSDDNDDDETHNNRRNSSSTILVWQRLAGAHEVSHIARFHSMLSFQSSKSVDGTHGLSCRCQYMWVRTWMRWRAKKSNETKLLTPENIHARIFFWPNKISSHHITQALRRIPSFVNTMTKIMSTEFIFADTFAATGSCYCCLKVFSGLIERKHLLVRWLIVRFGLAQFSVLVNRETNNTHKC